MNGNARGSEAVNNATPLHFRMTKVDKQRGKLLDAFDFH
jgi:hypothetical protein